MIAARDRARSPFDAYAPYYFVRLDEAGYCLSEGPLLLGGDDEAIALARHILTSAMLVAIYQDGRKVSLLVKLC
jgi:hypothetical protein